MIEFHFPEEWRPRPPARTGLTSLLGSLVLPSEEANSFWSDAPPIEETNTPRVALGMPPLHVANSPEPPWRRTVEAIDVIMAQRARGFAPSVELPASGPTYQDAQARLTPAIATAVGAGGTAGTAGGGFAALAARVVPLLAAGAAAAPVAAAALPFLLIPTNSQSGTVDLGGGLRARIAPGQRRATIERRVDNGVLGSGLGVRWKELPVEATVGAGPDGRQTVFVDRGELERLIRAEVAGSLWSNAAVAGAPRPTAVPLPIILEIRIGSSTDAGVTVSHREATRDEVLEVCPNFAEYERLALKAAQNAQAAGLSNGLDYGNRVHNEMEAELKKMSEVQKMLRDRGIRELRPEIALLKGEQQSYFPKGSSRLDVLEIHRRKTVCVYDFKTGNARFPDAVITRYAREAALYVQTLPYGYTHIYVVPVRVP